jgi:hypothetical protein
MGQGQPPSGSISADAQRIAAINEGDTKTSSKGQLDPTTQSALDRSENLQSAAEQVAPKMVSPPGCSFPNINFVECSNRY